MAKITETKLVPSPELADVIGGKEVTRPQAIKLIWDYIKKNNLQDAKNKRMINADDKLMKIFKKKQISMFELAKIISANLK